MVKAQAGVLETDDDVRAEEKLYETVVALGFDPADVQWLERHLRPLVGLEAGGEAGADRRSEAFAAWRRFFEALAEQRPLVLVFEDLHFADDGLLDFVDHLVDWASGVPLLVVGTARPELLVRRAGWGGGKPHALTLSLSPLSDDETAQLVHALLERPVLNAVVQETLLERAAGNPLYAEEFVRIVEEHHSAEELPLPETVQGLIAARLDGLAPEEKAILQDAAVLGKVFWLGAVAALSEVERWAAEELLHALERKEFVRRERRSSVAGETEYAFRHLLVRDVAYGQIPRPPRAKKHQQAAAWIASLARPEDHAETVAHHYVSALDLLRAAGRLTPEIAERARVALRDAGDRAFALNAYANAAHLYEQALELWPGEDRARPDLLSLRAHALHLAADERRFEALEVARDALIEAGDRDGAAEAQALLARAWWYRGKVDRARTAFERAVALLADGSPTAARARVLAGVSGMHALEGRHEEAIRVGRDALAAADRHGLDEVRAAALTTVGMARAALGDDGGIADLEESRRVALHSGALHEAVRACNNLAMSLTEAGELPRAFALLDEAARLAEQSGNVDLVRFGQAMLLLSPLDDGRWDDCVRLADAFIAECEAGAPHTSQASVHCHRGSIRLARNETEAAVADAERALELVREGQQPQRLFQALAFAVRAFAESGAVQRARKTASDFLTIARSSEPPWWSYIHFAWAATEVGYAEELERLLAGQKRQTKWIVVTRAVVRGEHAEAAELFAQMGTRPHEAYARLRLGERLVVEGRRAEADEQLAKALAFFRSVGATRYMREAEALLSASADGRTSVGH
jgi:tetratricopeptide (TPR) repeat protein